MSRSEEEFRAFVISRAASLHRTAYLLCGDWHLADDLVQEALAKAFRHWKRVQRADSPDAYVRRILINEANRRWRARRDLVLRAEEADPDRVTSDLADEVVDRAELLSRHSLGGLQLYGNRRPVRFLVPPRYERRRSRGFGEEPRLGGDQPDIHWRMGKPMGKRHSKRLLDERSVQ